MKILNAKDLTELREIGYEINLFHEGSKGLKSFNPIWINPNTFWNCEISNRIVKAKLYKYQSKTDRSNVKLIRY